MTSSPAGNKLPNINGLRDSNPRHSLGYRVQHRARTVVASVIVAMLVFAGTQPPRHGWTWTMSFSTRRWM